MAKFKVGDYVGVEHYGEGYVVVPEIEVNGHDTYFTGVGVLFPSERTYVVVPEAETYKSSKPHLYALKETIGRRASKIVDYRAYLSLEEAEHALEDFHNRNDNPVELVEIEVNLPWKVRE